MANRTLPVTPKQMRFCEEYLKNGGNGTQAYLAAYDSNSPMSAGIEASRLLKQENIQKYLEHLRKPVEQAVKRKMIRDKKAKIELIQERIAECVERGDDAAIARYLELWNKMDGTYSNASGDAADTDTDIAGLDTATLRLLAKAE